MTATRNDSPRVETPAQLVPLIAHYAGPEGVAPRLTDTGFEVRDVPPALWARMMALLGEQRELPQWFQPEYPHPGAYAAACLVDEGWDLGALDEASGVPSLAAPDGDRRWFPLLEAFRPLHEAWAGIPLQSCVVYGPRIYQPGALLLRHVDVPTTHVVSSSITLDADLDAPWPLWVEVDDVRHEVALSPGQMMFYEGSRVPHYRPYPLRGRHYTNIYLHYYPAGVGFDRARMTWNVGR